ncbi:hypothetical protein PBRA_007339 [Plasmodiophora brassicae]|uniref:Uncharacterized protein n=1 Tax=Plasmodiophora brassicae TaxID=37360 RepID=A0A0G4IX46_PLABS|nr:hypothetical protein PBRA_007339 [Plasmodiophora brassicae]
MSADAPNTSGRTPCTGLAPRVSPTTWCLPACVVFVFAYLESSMSRGACSLYLRSTATSTMHTTGRMPTRPTRLDDAMLRTLPSPVTTLPVVNAAHYIAIFD